MSKNAIWLAVLFTAAIATGCEDPSLGVTVVFEKTLLTPTNLEYQVATYNSDGDQLYGTGDLFASPSLLDYQQADGGIDENGCTDSYLEVVDPSTGEIVFKLDPPTCLEGPGPRWAYFVTEEEFNSYTG